MDEGDAAIEAELDASDDVMRSRRASRRANRPEVVARVNTISPEMERRASPFLARRAEQQARLDLPAFPTTTIGSFPQTTEVRRVRAAFGGGELTQSTYDEAIEGWIAEAVDRQEDLGLDVLVHGEFERNDMV